MQSTFEVRVKGLVPMEKLGGFIGMYAVMHEGYTVLRGVLRDQLALVGLVSYVEELGFRVVEMRRLPAPSAVLS